MKFFLLVLATFIISTATTKGQHIIYVTPTGVGDGSDWANAYNNPQTAIDVAQSGDQIWVAAGSYFSNNVNDYVFVLKEGVRVYGGFNGTEADISERNWTTNITILEGGYTSSANATVNATNLSSACVFDGFTIKPYQASGPICRGMYNDNSSLVISNCTFNGNITNSTVTQSGDGSAMYNTNGSNPTIIDCIFSNNTTTGSGGAIYNNSSSPIVTNCIFFGNTATAGSGGAIYNSNSNAVFYNCKLTGNSASGLSSNGRGGAYYNIAGAPLIINCLVADNKANGYGGGIFNSGSNMTITNCTIIGNTVKNDNLGGSAICYYTGASGFITNSIIWGNPVPNSWNPEIDIYSGEDPSVANCIIADGLYGAMSQSPEFVDSANGNYELRSYSPAIDAGLNSALPQYDTADLAGNARVFNNTTDIGAYEQHILGNSILGNGSLLLTGLNGSINVTGTSVSSDIGRLIYQWQIVAAPLDGSTSSFLVSPADYSDPTLSLILKSYGVTFDNNDFIIDDVSRLPVLMGVLSPGADSAYWHNFIGNIYISRIVGPDPTPDSSISNTITVQIQAAPLPVTLTSFSGSLKNDVASLQWNTGIENNFDSFEIEKSTNGKNYVKIATITAKGNFSAYAYDTPQSEPTAYYRLQLINDDGTSLIYSKTVTLSQRDGGNVSVYPNPAKDCININVASAGVVSIYDTGGRLIKTQSLQTGLNRIKISNLNVGVYYGIIGGRKITFMKK